MPNAPGTLANPHWLQGDDLTGTEFGWWTVIRQVEKPTDATIKFRGTWWLCRCRCGTERVMPRQYIISRQTGSCGCRKRKKQKPDVKKLTPKPEKEKKRQRKHPPGLDINFDRLVKECKCAQCGKTFERLSDEWAYKQVVAEGRKKWYCSWKCLRLATAKQRERERLERM